MTDITFEDNREEWEKDKEKIQEALQLCQDTKAQLRMSKEAIVKIAKERGEPMLCTFCRKDITFDYDLTKIEKHMNICKSKLSKEEIARCFREGRIRYLKVKEQRIFCKYCKKEITFDYNEKKIQEHLIACKTKLMEKDIANG